MARKQLYFQGNHYGTRNDQDHRTDKQSTCAASSRKLKESNTDASPCPQHE